MEEKIDLNKIPRNNTLLDWWSSLHVLWGIVLTFIFGPVVAFIALLVWEPVEIFLISKIFARYFNRVFGHESLKNSLSDIVMNTIGVAIGYGILLLV